MLSSSSSLSPCIFKSCGDKKVTAVTASSFPSHSDDGLNAEAMKKDQTSAVFSLFEPLECDRNQLCRVFSPSYHLATQETNTYHPLSTQRPSHLPPSFTPFDVKSSLNREGDCQSAFVLPLSSEVLKVCTCPHLPCLSCVKPKSVLDVVCSTSVNGTTTASSSSIPISPSQSCSPYQPTFFAFQDWVQQQDGVIDDLITGIGSVQLPTQEHKSILSASNEVLSTPATAAYVIEASENGCTLLDGPPNEKRRKL
jgi:hypothetical protein